MSEILNGRTSELEQSQFIELPPATSSAIVVVSDDDWSDTVKDAIEALPQVWTRGLLYTILNTWSSNVCSLASSSGC